MPRWGASTKWCHPKNPFEGANLRKSCGVSLGQLRRSSARLGRGFVERGVAGVEVLFVHSVLRDPERVAEPLEMDDLALPQEFQRIADVGIVDQAEQVVVGDPRFLLGKKVKKKFGGGIRMKMRMR